MNKKDSEKLINAYFEFANAEPDLPENLGIDDEMALKWLGDNGLAIKISRNSYEVLLPFLSARWEEKCSIDGGKAYFTNDSQLGDVTAILTEDEAILHRSGQTAYRMWKLFGWLLSSKSSLKDFVGDFYEERKRFLNED